MDVGPKLLATKVTCMPGFPRGMVLCLMVIATPTNVTIAVKAATQEEAAVP